MRNLSDWLMSLFTYREKPAEAAPTPAYGVPPPVRARHVPTPEEKERNAAIYAAWIARTEKQSAANFARPAEHAHRLYEQKPTGKRYGKKKDSNYSSSNNYNNSSDDGFVMGLATGVPVPFTPMSVLGASLHNSMQNNSMTSYSPSTDSGSSSSGSFSTDTSSSSNTDSGSFSTGGSFD